MTQISRPFQIALAAIGLLGVVWFFTLRGHSASTGNAGSSVSSSQAPAQPARPTAPSTPTSGSAGANGAAAPTPVYHGAAPGVEGLTRAIAKAHEAVATSQQNARQVEEKSAPQAPSSSTRHASETHGAAASTVTSTAKGGSTKGSPPMQQAVEAELKQGKVVAILFWKPKASVDESVRRELQAVAHALGGKIAVHEARANQAGSFGSITRAIQIYQTPTILLVNKRGHTTTLTGLTDVFSLEQAIDEARNS
jgi:hypothetical protein